MRQLLLDKDEVDNSTYQHLTAKSGVHHRPQFNAPQRIRGRISNLCYAAAIKCGGDIGSVYLVERCVVRSGYYSMPR
jgi:hypothetical protein